MIGILHFLYHDLLYFFFLFRIDGEIEFIVYLDDHFALDAFSFESVEDANHRNLDDVGLRTLDRGIDGIALGKTAYCTIAAIDVW